MSRMIMFVILLLIYLESSHQSLLVLFRPRSRHTSTLSCDIYPQYDDIIIDNDEWTAPHIELIDLYHQHGGKGIRIKSYANNENLQAFVQFKRVEIDNIGGNLNALIDAVAKSVLSYCLYEVLVEEKSLSQIIEQFNNTTNNSKDNILSDVAIGIPDDPYISKKELSGVLNKLSHVWNKLSSNLSATLKIKLFINNLMDYNHNSALICNQLSKSLAVPLLNGEGNREPLPQKSEGNRRPVSGVFKKFSLNKMPFKLKTSMEPELSLLMSSFANINKNSIVVDPFCGSCQLLLAAALKGAEINIGADVEILEDKIKSNFVYMKLKPPTILHQALPETLNGSIICTAIITDPPYAMSENIHYIEDEIVVTRNDIINEVDANLYTNKIIQNLLVLASACLISKGRLIFFLPFRHKNSNISTNESRISALSALPQLPDNLSFLFSLRQVLSPTFSRFLIVIEKK